MVCAGVLDGAYAGRVFVDEPQHPQGGFVTKGSGWWFLAGNAHHAAFNQALNAAPPGALEPARGAGARQFPCIYCLAQPGALYKGKALAKADFTVDHVIPRSRGGRDNWGNTACACYVCNHRKGDRLPHEAGMRMHWEPKIPRTSYLVVAVGSGNEVWKRYIEY